MTTAARQFYTMVEIIAVCAIIMILAGIGAGGYRTARAIMAKSVTESTLNKLRLAIESYKSKYGYYPHSTGTVMNFHLDIIDFNSPTGAGNPSNNLNQFLDYGRMQRDECVSINGIYYVKDGYKTPHTTIGGVDFSAIRYRCPGVRNPTAFDIYSAGPSGDFSKTDDNIYAK